MQMRIASRGPRLALVCGFIAICFHLPTSRQGNGIAARGAATGNCIECHQRADGRAREVVGLHLRSSHAQIGCQACHGGDPSQDDKARAHGAGFVGKPDRAETLVRCGRCHEQPLALFKSSRHFPERKNIPRLDCAECHGAHTVGDPPETFGFTTLCSSCHGLEYLPDLPAPLQQLLALTDELRDLKRVAEWKKQVVPEAFIAGRRELRHQISEIVHPTDIKGGLPKIPAILERGESVRTLITK